MSPVPFARRGVMLALALACSPALGCAHGEPQGANGKATGGKSAPAAPPDLKIAASYDLTYDATRGDLTAVARIPRGLSETLDVERGVAPFIVDGTVESQGKTRPLVHQAEAGFPVAECMQSDCVVHYRVRLREAAGAIDDIDTAKRLGEKDAVIEAPPPTFILAPWGAPAATRIRFHVTVPAGVSFVTGVFPAPDDPSSFELTMDDFGSSPYSAFGTMKERTVSVPGGNVNVAFIPGPLALNEQQLLSWVENSARAVSSYYGGLPVAREQLLLLPGGPDGIGFGKSLAGGGVTVFVAVGEDATTQDLAKDWVLTHELIHAAFPAQPRELDWVEEGLATYVEPIARARIGTMSNEAVWSGLVGGLHFGLPEAKDRGIDRTQTWGRRYWGGALFFFLADLEIRRETKGKASLRTALQAILHQVSSNAHRGNLAHAFEVGDKATGTHVLTTQHQAWADTPVPVDLPAVFAALGVHAVGDGRRHEDRAVTFDDKAPEAALRIALTSADSP